MYTLNVTRFWFRLTAYKTLCAIKYGEAIRSLTWMHLVANSFLCTEVKFCAADLSLHGVFMLRCRRWDCCQQLRTASSTFVTWIQKDLSRLLSTPSKFFIMFTSFANFTFGKGSRIFRAGCPTTRLRGPSSPTFLKFCIREHRYIWMPQR